MALRERLVRETAQQGAALFGKGVEEAGQGSAQTFQEMKSRLHRAIINRMDLTKLGQLEPEQLHAEVSRLAEDRVTAENAPLSSSERGRLGRERRHGLA